MAVKVLEIVFENGGVRDYRERWSRLGIHCVRLPFKRAPDAICGPVNPAFIFDCVVMQCARVVEDDRSISSTRMSIESLLLAKGIRLLPPHSTMFDGRQWRSIPFVILTPRVTFNGSLLKMRDSLFAEHLDLLHGLQIVPLEGDEQAGARVIKKCVETYRLALLAEFDDMGFIVSYRAGRYSVSPALKPRNEFEGRYYFRAGDARPTGFFTVHEDSGAIQREVEAFEALINHPDVSEGQLQRFFEEHPHFLSPSHMPLPQVRLSRQDGSVLIPDFILKPVVAQQRDSSWEVLDLKRPQEKLLAGKGSRARLSSRVMSAIRQLRDYQEHFIDPRHAPRIASLLGHPLRYPQIGVLIGRLANTDVTALEREQRQLMGVKIVTYDEILERQQAQFDR